jgi:surface polysaccharide O-acyltransferase-like enzyme
MKQEPWIDFARVFSVFAVVLLHTAAASLTIETIGSGGWWAGNLYDSLTRWCVPVFVMISGALLLREDSTENIQVFYRKRLKKVLIPLVAWTFIYLLIDSIIQVTIQNRSITQVAKSNIISIASGRPYYHLWYLYMLVPLYLSTPFINMVIKSCKRNILWVLTFVITLMAALQFLSNTLVGARPLTLPINWFISYIPYFLAGYMISRSRFKPALLVSALVFSVSVAVTAFGTYFLFNRTKDFGESQYFYNYFSVTVFPMSLSVFYIFKAAQGLRPPSIFLEKLAMLTFGVYLIHPIFINVLSVNIYDYFKPHPSFGLPANAILVFMLSLAAAFLISRTPYLRKIV